MDLLQLQELLLKLLSYPSETEWVEFKENNYKPEVIGERISALSNSANLLEKDFGYLVFGIKDHDHQIVGTTFRPKQEKRGNELIEHWIFQMLNPKMDFRIYEFECQGKFIVLFQVPAAIDRPVLFQNKGYVRINSITRELKDFPEKEKKIWLNRGNRSFEKEIAQPNVSPQDVLKLLDYSGYFSLTDQPLPSDTNGFLTKMEEDKLIKKNIDHYDITNLGALLFAKDLKNFETIRRKSVRVIIYKGKDRVQTIKEQEGNNGYAVGFAGLIEYVNNQLPGDEKIEKALRIEKKMYPEIALREIIANALIHQDFSERGTGPLIEIFEDRIETTNPGAPLISVERFIDHTPQSRNEELAAFMRRIKICEERGSGIDKVITSIELYQLPGPKFQTQEKFTKITLYSYQNLTRMNKEDKVRACYQHCVLKYISNESMTNNSLRNRFNIAENNYPMASRIMSDTIEAGLIKAIDPEQRKHAKYIPFWA
ncbi:MAG: RNA-binding domain-containing protein [Candidatus Gracilibacteria bacterium]|jgi:predicted HTH transcriptional regulator